MEKIDYVKYKKLVPQQIDVVGVLYNHYSGSSTREMAKGNERVAQKHGFKTKIRTFDVGGKKMYVLYAKK